MTSPHSHAAPSPHAEPDPSCREVEVASARLLRTWRWAALAAAALPMASASMSVLLLWLPASPHPYTGLWAVLTVPLLYNATRFFPRAPSPEGPTVPLSANDAETLATWVAACADGWRPDIRLSPHPIVRPDGEALVIGLPLWKCLSEHELAALVRDARGQHEVMRNPRVAQAFRVMRGEIGRGLRGRRGRDARLGRLFLCRLDARSQELVEAYHACVEALRARRGPDWGAIAQAADTVVEAWEILATCWLEPALRRGVWHADPFTGLEEFIAGCEQVGLIEADVRRHRDASAASLLRDAAAYERALAELLVASSPHEAEPTAWSDHPRTVSEHRWRTTLADGLQAAYRATGTPQPGTLGNLLSLLEYGWGDALAASIHAAHADGSKLVGPRTRAVLQVLLEAAVSVALLDGKVATLTWAWPLGTCLRGPHGTTLDVPAVVSDLVSDLADPESATSGGRALRVWLGALGVDADAPLWLGGGAEPPPEQAKYAFEAYQGMRTYHVVVTDRALRLFHRGPVQGTREALRMQMTGAASVLAHRMEAVESGDLADQSSELRLASIVDAAFAPLIGGHWWRLRLRTPEQRLTLRGNGDGRELEAVLAPMLKDRLQTRWLHAHRWLRRARNGLGYACLGLGSFGLIMAAVVLVSPPVGFTRTGAAAVAAISVLILLIGFLPDLVAAAVRRARQPSPNTAVLRPLG